MKNKQVTIKNEKELVERFQVNELEDRLEMGRWSVRLAHDEFYNPGVKITPGW